MVALVEDRPGKEPFALVFIQIAVAVIGLHLHVVGPLHIAALAGEGEAALHAALKPGGLQNPGVHQLQGSVLALGTAHVDDHHPAQHPYLGSGQAHAVRIVHGVEHIVDELGEPFVENGDLPALLIQTGVLLFADRSDGHSILLLYTSCYYTLPRGVCKEILPFLHG